MAISPVREGATGLDSVVREGSCPLSVSHCVQRLSLPFIRRSRAREGSCNPRLSLSSASRRGDFDGPWNAEISEAKRRFGIPESWIHAVIDAESGGKSDAVSLKGALGLMQLMPETWAEMRAKLQLGNDPFDPRDNVLAGTAYLRDMLDLYGIPDFLAAYNAGPNRFENARAAGQELPKETLGFVAAVAPKLGFDTGLERRSLAAKPSPDALFESASPDSNHVSWRRLFFILKSASGGSTESNQQK